MKREKENIEGVLGFLILITIFILTILFETPAKLLILGSIPWLLTIFGFFVSMAVGVWLGLRKGKAK